MATGLPQFHLFDSAGATRAGYDTCDWKRSAVGTPDTWPRALAGAVSLILESQFPMFVVWGPQLAFLYNAAYIPLLDDKHPFALGEPLKQVWPELWSGVAPLVEQALAGQPTFGEDVPRTLRRHGRKLTGWFTLSYSAVRHEDGAIGGALCVISETTGRVLLEKRQALQLQLIDRMRDLSDPSEIVRVASEMLGHYLDASHVFYAEVDDAAGTFVIRRDWVRNGDLTLAGRGAALEDFGPAMIADLRAGHSVTIDDVRADPRTAGHTHAYDGLGVHSLLALPLARDGRLAATLNVHDSGPRAWSAEDRKLAADIAERTWSAVERVRAEQALRLADRRKDEFLAMLAHELRNPLAPISAAAQLLNMGPPDAARVARTSTIIARQVAHMTGLIDDLLDVSRVTGGLVVLTRDEVDVKRVVADAVEQVRPLIETRRHHLTVHTEPDSALVEGDYKRLVQVLANLLNNAAKYTPEGGKLLVWMGASDGQVLMRVSDNGIGIAADLLPTVFELFSQAERTPDRAQGGLGLGLALVKSLVELHGGSVAASSAGRDSGSQFTVRLPRLMRAGSSEQTRSAESAAPAPRATPRAVLLVDDNVDAAQTLCMLLESAGHTVTVAHDPAAALTLARMHPFDACLLDIGLPGMDGHQLARRLRALPHSRNALMIAITGYGQLPGPGGAQGGQFDHYFVKPADPVELFALLAQGTQNR